MNKTLDEFDKFLGDKYDLTPTTKEERTMLRIFEHWMEFKTGLASTAKTQSQYLSEGSAKEEEKIVTIDEEGKKHAKYKPKGS